MSKINLLLGLQWGDEGKGKIVDIFTNQHEIVARFQGGPNAGHTLVFEGNKHVLHTIPSGIFHEKVTNIVGNGVVIDPSVFKKEIDNLEKYNFDLKQRLKLSKMAHIILPTHKLIDAVSEASKGKAKIGSTLKGIGPAYMDKTGRNGLRIGDLLQPNWQNKYHQLKEKHLKIIQSYDYNPNEINLDITTIEKEFFEGIEVILQFESIDSVAFMHDAMRQNKTILAEGAQGTMLDIDFGTYPYVTSSNTSAAGACIGLGVPPSAIGKVFGVMKAYTTRVGSGPFPTELFDEIGDRMTQKGNEFGSTTGRKRRCGWLDLVALKYAVQLNGVTELIMMKADVLSGFDTLKVCTSYQYQDHIIDYFPFNIEENVVPVYTELKGWQTDLTNITHTSDLPKELLHYIQFIEKYLNINITLLSVGPDRKQIITL